MLTTTDHLDAIVRDSAALAAVARTAGLDTPVRSCPGWTVADLVVHVGNVQRWAATIVSTLPAERISRTAMNEEPGPTEILPWFEAASTSLVDALGAADPSAPVWTFTADRTVRFWFRRQAHEVAVHRWDAEAAAGDARAIDTARAADGVAEWLDLSLTGLAKLTGHSETVHLHCTDTDEGSAGEWLITLAADGPTIVPVHAKGDVAARGTASDLDLFVWGRVDASALEVFGDADLLRRFRDAGAA